MFKSKVFWMGVAAGVLLLVLIRKVGAKVPVIGPKLVEVTNKIL